MAEVTVGIRELKIRLSGYLRKVKAGDTILVTERGEPVGRLVPVGESLDEKIQRLEQSGFLSGSGRNLEIERPRVRVRGPRTVADLLLEDR